MIGYNFMSVHGVRVRVTSAEYDVQENIKFLPDGWMENVGLGLFYAHTHPIIALQEASGPYLSIVRFGACPKHTGIEQWECRTVKIIHEQDASDIMDAFARFCMINAFDLSVMPDVVIRYLNSGDKDLRTAAKEAFDFFQECGLSLMKEKISAAVWNPSWEAAAIMARAINKATIGYPSRAGSFQEALCDQLQDLVGGEF